MRQRFNARYLIAATLLSVLCSPAFAAPPSSCAAKFIGEWRHTGGNKGTLTPDGRALCSEHAGCVQGSWTCSGNVLTYTNSIGTWNYTLEPDGKSMSTNGGAAVAVRMGAVPASARARDLGSAAKNVTADILGIDRTPSAAPDPAPVAAPKPAAAQPTEADNEKLAAARYGRTLFGAGMAAFNVARQSSYASRKRELQVAEDNFIKSAEQFHKAGDAKNEAKAKANIDKIRAIDARTPERAPAAGTSPKPKLAGGKPSKEQCAELRGQINISIVSAKNGDPLRQELLQQRDKLDQMCR